VSPLPDWLAPLPDAEEMRAVDRWAIDQRGVPSLELMERAGAGVAASVERLAPDGPVTVVCGKGNNGGDGLVVARLLRQAGRPVAVVSLAPASEISGDARANLERLPGEPPVGLDGEPWQGARHGGADTRPFGSGAAPAAVVDAVLGTGFAGTPRGAAAEAIAAINHAGAPVVAVDVPSGVDASSGVVADAAVSATVTVSFHAAKPGLWIFPGKAHAGTVETIDIGIPRGAPLHASVGLLGPGLLALLPRRGPTWTKFRSGQVLVVGGSRGLTGAPAMAARAAMRAGAGYVTACVPLSLQPVIASCGTPEMMTRGLADADGALVPDAVAAVLEAADRGGTIALGPGLGRSEGAFALARAIAAVAAVPLVIDADGLNAQAGRLQELAGRGAATVLTPHAGELARLLELDSAEIERRRLHHVREAARLADAVVVLKGDDSLVAAPDGSVAVSPGATPALATAGTGDVLTGVIAALLAQGLEPLAAAAAGVWLHAEAGRQAARALGAVEGVIAGDVIEALPAARARACAPAGAGRADGARPDGGEARA
jgi:NAD(P)H-hydrate epimerase